MIERNLWGEAFGKEAALFTLKNGNGITARITTYGARLTEFWMPDKNGQAACIVLGFATLGEYLKKPEPYLGCTVGRVANRIAGGKFTLDGKTYSLFINNGPNSLHGGKRGFDKMIWDAEPARTENTIDFSYLSPDGEEGYPGTLKCRVRYSLNDENELTIEYEADSDKPTPVNLTNHTYFNLKGAGQGDILDHSLTIAADSFTPVDSTLIPTGEIRAVKGTPMDFTSPMTIGSRIKEAGGYDHNFCLRPSAASLAVALEEKSSGRRVQISTSQPGVQIYTGNYLDGTLSGIGGTFIKHGAIAIETQHYPDSVNQPSFPTVILRPGQTYRHWVKYRFSIAP